MMRRFLLQIICLVFLSNSFCIAFTTNPTKLYLDNNAFSSPSQLRPLKATTTVTTKNNDENGDNYILQEYQPLFQAVLENINNEESSSEKIKNNINFTEAQRIFHGRGGMYPGRCESITLDWFPPVWLLTSYNEKLSEDIILSINTTLNNEQNVGDELVLKNFVYQYRNDTGCDTTLISGSVPNDNNHIIMENNMNFYVDLINKNKNHGLFLDMKNGREWVRQNSENNNVLNLFSYTCGFSIAALMGGATQVVNVDMASGPMKVGMRNHEINNFTDGGGRARFLKHNIFKTWGKIKKLGPYDTIIVDPPSFQKNSFVAKKDYCRIIRRLPDLLKNKDNNDDDSSTSKVLLCLNAPELDSTWLMNQVLNEAPELEFIQRIPNPESFPSLYPERALKVLLFQLRAVK